MTRKQLIEEVLSELNVSSAFANKIPTAEIDRIIDRALKWFYQEYEHSVHEKFLVVKKEYFASQEFRKNRSVQLPDCIESVYDVWSINGAGLLGTIEKDLSDIKLIGSEIYLSGTLGDNLVNFGSRVHFFNLAQSLILNRYQHDWNHNTHTLYFKGHDPTIDIALFCLEKIPEDSLFEDQLFIRYVVAEGKRSMGRILGRYNYNMIGGITINYADIKTEGDQELADVKTEIDSKNTGDWMLFFF